MNKAEPTGQYVIALSTSGAYEFCVGKHLAMAAVPIVRDAEGTQLTVEILDKRYEAIVIAKIPHAPKACVRAHKMRRRYNCVTE